MDRSATPVVHSGWEETVIFDDLGPLPRVIVETDRLKAVVVGLKAGQVVPLHPSTEAVYHFLDGAGTMTVDDETYAVHTGTTIVVPDGSNRGITAITDIAFLGTRPADNAQNAEESHHHH